jgi:hypothetical protein
MQIIIGVIVLLVLVTVLRLIVIAISKGRSRKKTERLLLAFSHLGTDNDLSFTSQELLGNRVIGLDGLKRKLLFIEDNDAKYRSLVIDLDAVRTCTVKLKYIGFSISLKRRNPEEYLEKISLQFEGNDKKVIDVPFYVFHKDNISNKRLLEQKARDWETILSKMIINKDAKIA